MVFPSIQALVILVLSLQIHGMAIPAVPSGLRVFGGTHLEAHSAEYANNRGPVDASVIGHSMLNHSEYVLLDPFKYLFLLTL